MTAFQTAVHLASALESLENYAVADSPLLETARPASDAAVGAGAEAADHYKDSEFWTTIFTARAHDQQSGWGRRHRVHYGFLTEWVARVPGLYWRPGSKRLRDQAAMRIESVSQGWTTYTPPGKSDKVAGGIGTLRFPHDAQGNRLATVSCGLNASSGIPMLLSDDLWQQAQRSGGFEGRFAPYVSGIWQKMGPGWVDRFESIKGIPQGYLIVDRWELQDQIGPVQFHPCSIMEYATGNRRLFDFVYDMVDTGNRHWRRDVAQFFESYKGQSGRAGRYLTNADIADPLWDADFNSPRELRQRSANGRSHLELLQARIRERLDGADLIEQTMEKLGRICNDKKDLGAYSDALGMSRMLWSIDGSLADNVASFVAAVQQRTGKLEELIQRIALNYPEV